MTDLAALAAQHRDHSIFAPSGAHVWAHCAGSLVAGLLRPDDGNIYAAEGTVAHTAADTWLRSRHRPGHLIGKTVLQDGYEITIDAGMLAYVEQYVDWVQETDGDQYFEQRVDLSSLFPIGRQGGTADHFACEMRKLTITDLKYGKGIQVFAKDNPQLMLYAYGVFEEWDWYYGFESIVLRICQPRLDHFDVHTVSRDELLAFADWIRDRALECWRVDAPRSPGPHCTNCKAVRGCPAFVNLLEGDADAAFSLSSLQDAAERSEDVFGPDIHLPELSIGACARLLPMRGAVEKWFAAMEEFLFEPALNGEVPGWKVVEGRARREWEDTDRAEDRMVELEIDPFEKKLKSPNQAEEALHAKTGMTKVQARKLTDSYTTKKPGSRSLVRMDDKREALSDDGSVFDGE